MSGLGSLLHGPAWVPLFSNIYIFVFILCILLEWDQVARLTPKSRCHFSLPRGMDSFIHSHSLHPITEPRPAKIFPALQQDFQHRNSTPHGRLKQWKVVAPARFASAVEGRLPAAPWRPQTPAQGLAPQGSTESMQPLPSWGLGSVGTDPAFFLPFEHQWRMGAVGTERGSMPTHAETRARRWLSRAPSVPEFHTTRLLDFILFPEILQDLLLFLFV